MHAGGGTNDHGEKRNVLIVSVLLLIGSNLTLRSNMQRRIQILRVRQATVLLHVAGRPKPAMGDAEVKDQTPAPGLTPEIVPNLHIASPVGPRLLSRVLVRTVCPAVRNNGPSTDTIQSCALVAPE